MSLRLYDNTVNEDRLSSALLYEYDADKDMTFSIDKLRLAPCPIVLGLNKPKKYKVAFRYHNRLECSIIFHDLQLLMCSAYSTSKLMYYNGVTVTSVPASSADIIVSAYLPVNENNKTVCKLAAKSDKIVLNKLALPNNSHQYTAGECDVEGYDTQFGSLGVFWGDTSNRCLSPVKIDFKDRLIIPPHTSCYFVFEAENYSDENGGFAVCATEDYRAININAHKTMGIKKKVNGKWVPATLYRRIEGKWVPELSCSYVRDELSIAQPYNPKGTPEMPEPSDTPDIIYDGTTWYVNEVTANNMPMSWYGETSNNNEDEQYWFNVIDNTQGPQFYIDMTDVESISVTVKLIVGSSIDGYSAITFAVSIGDVERTHSIETILSDEHDPQNEVMTTLSIPKSGLSGMQLVSIKIKSCDGDGAHMEANIYKCSGSAIITKITATVKE